MHKQSNFPPLAAIYSLFRLILFMFPSTLHHACVSRPSSSLALQLSPPSRLDKFSPLAGSLPTGRTRPELALDSLNWLVTPSRLLCKTILENFYLHHSLCFISIILLAEILETQYFKSLRTVVVKKKLKFVYTILDK